MAIQVMPDAAKRTTAAVGAGARDSKVLAYKMGATRQFGFADIGRQGLLSGWAEPEKSHVWNNGLVARLALEMEPPASACKLTVQGEPFIVPQRPVQDITLYGNGHWLGFCRFSKAATSTMEALIEPEIFWQRGTAARLTLAWCLPTSAKPADLGNSKDGRELGFVFYNLTMDAA